MSAYRYPVSAIRPDYLRAGAGLALTLGPLVLAPAGVIGGTVLAALAALFALFALRTWARQRQVVDCTSDGISVSGLFGRELTWNTLRSLELRYYATKRDRTKGWMQLTLKDADTTLRFESTLDGFDRLAAAAARAAVENDVALSPATIENLRVIGIGIEAADHAGSPS